MGETVVWLYDEDFRSFDPAPAGRRRMGRMPTEAQARFLADTWIRGAIISDGENAKYNSPTETACLKRGWLMPYPKYPRQTATAGIFVPSPEGLRALAAFLLRAPPIPKPPEGDRPE